MPKPNRGGQRRSVADVVTEVITQSGDVADLTEYPLTYDSNDEALSGKNRNVVEAFEKKHATKKSEYGLLVDKNGNVLQEAHGGKGSVKMSQNNYAKAEVMTHIHPRGKGDEGCLGGTFSTKDIDAFTRFPNLKTMRAAATEGVYTISRAENFNANGLAVYAQGIHINRGTHYKHAEKAAYAEYKKGDITYSEYLQKNKDAFNEYLVNVHNDLIAGQKKYGYSYRLERRSS